MESDIKTEFSYLISSMNRSDIDAIDVAWSSLDTVIREYLEANRETSYVYHTSMHLSSSFEELAPSFESPTLSEHSDELQDLCEKSSNNSINIDKIEAMQEILPDFESEFYKLLKSISND